MNFEAYDKFEYRFETFKGLVPKQKCIKMNELGQEGWELIYIEDSSAGHQYIFKRKLTCYKV